jgi:hypothetical protein
MEYSLIAALEQLLTTTADEDTAEVAGYQGSVLRPAYSLHTQPLFNSIASLHYATPNIFVSRLGVSPDG